MRTRGQPKEPENVNFPLSSLPHSEFRLRTSTCLAAHGMAGFVLANGSMSSHQSGEGDIRRALIEADLVDWMVALPGQLFYSTPISVCLWFLAKNKTDGASSVSSGLKRRNRKSETLFIGVQWLTERLEPPVLHSLS